MIYDKIIDKLMSHYTGAEFRDEVVQAKKEFFEDAGLVGDESFHFEVRMSQFLDWYLFTRELTEAHLPPVQLAFEDPPFPVDDVEKEHLASLVKGRHSLFEYLKTKGSNVYVKDLLENKKVILEDSHVTSGFNADEVFEVRIFPFEKTWVFSRGFCFHPAEAKSFILKEVKKVRHLDEIQKEALMFRLLKMRYKFEQYKHIRLDYIYTNDTKLRI
jgi:hypothetical protein